MKEALCVHVLRLDGQEGALRTRCGRLADQMCWVAFLKSFFLVPLEDQCRACRRSCLSEAVIRGLLRTGCHGREPGNDAPQPERR